MNYDRHRHSLIVEQLHKPDSVAHCLIYQDMLDVSPEFDKFARKHFGAIHGISWPDLCPAYALGLMTHTAYQLPTNDEELETLWQELANSDIEWSQAQQVVKDVWKFLDDSENDSLPGIATVS